MAKTKISNADLVWVITEELKAFDDFPLQGIPIAIVPTAGAGWQALTSRNVHARRAHWASRVQAIQNRLQKKYTVVA
jgi:hypothetical protein